MMISPSEAAPESGGFGGRLVLPLEFHALEELAEGRKEEPPAEPAFAQSERQNLDEPASLEQRIAAQTAEMQERVETARNEAWTEARETLGRECEEKVELERAALIKVCEQFSRERAKYFADVEAEVVRLSLSIAARVLNREAQFDPLLLRGAVKVALAKVYDESKVTLRVPPDQIEDWRAIVADGEVVVTVIGDANLGRRECLLETSVGRVELGVMAQLQEIERGFFDLLGQRPA
jgi:flagellar assembly protein FliH